MKPEFAAEGPCMSLAAATAAVAAQTRIAIVMAKIHKVVHPCL